MNEQMLKRATWLIVETEIPCEHGHRGIHPHNVMDGAVVLYECIPGTEVWQIDLRMAVVEEKPML